MREIAGKIGFHDVRHAFDVYCSCVEKEAQGLMDGIDEGLFKAATSYLSTHQDDDLVIKLALIRVNYDHYGFPPDPVKPHTFLKHMLKTKHPNLSDDYLNLTVAECWNTMPDDERQGLRDICRQVTFDAIAKSQPKPAATPAIYHTPKGMNVPAALAL